MAIQYLTLATVGIIGSFIYLFCLSIYRLYFSPVARFPGPKLAAASFWYEFYYDVYLGGQYGFKINELHDQYGNSFLDHPYTMVLTIEDLSSESTHTNYTFAIRTSTRYCTVAQARSEISGLGRRRCWYVL
jgi:hypothetical protein